MRHIVRSLVCGLLMAGGVCAGDEGSALPAKGGQAPATAVLFAPARPVFLQLRIEVDGQSLNRFRERAIAQWFRQLDRNHDQFLDKAEMADFLKGLAEQAPAGPRPTFQLADTDPVDGKLSPAEFRNFLNRQLGPPLALVVRKEAGSAVDASLFQHLDLNGDGVLTLDELRQANRSLAPLDADDDETISTAELMAVSQKPGATSSAMSRSRRQANQNTGATAAAERLPLVLLADIPAEALAEAMQHEYGAAAIKTAGRPELELSFQLFDQQRGRPRVSAVSATRPPAFQWHQESADVGTLVINGLTVALSAKRTRGATGDMSSFYALRFKIVDQDKNNYLDRREFAALGLPGAEFGAVDANGDGQIVPSELADYLKRQSNVYVNQVVIAVSDESPSLFNFLDTRADGRLSPRELNAAATRLAALDRNHDGNLTLGELRTQIRLDVEVKRPTASRPNILVARPRSESSVPVSPDLGPDWFRRMDRNYDGDVSWREFLGSREAFDKLDTDHDGLLSPEEAERAR